MKFTPLQSIITDDKTILATFWQRTFAIIIDLICVGVLYQFIHYIFIQSEINVLHGDLHGSKGLNLNFHLSDSIFAVFPVIYFTLLTYFTNGRTIGKWLLKIRTISMYQNKISLLNSFERALGYAVSGIEAGLGFLQIFWTTNRMCLHDQLAQTIVIQEKR